MMLREPLADGPVTLKTLDAAAAKEPYLGWLRDREVGRFLEVRFAEHSEQSLSQFIDKSNAAPNVGLAGIFLYGNHVGNIKVSVDRNHGRGEMGIMIGERSAWGRGVARTAIKLLSDYAFRELNVAKLTAGCYAGNIGSIRAFEAAGFQREAVRRGHYVCDGARMDGVYLARFAAGQETRT